MDQLQAERPKRGYALHCRACGLKSRYLYGIVENTRWGRAMLAKRRYNTRMRQGNPLFSPWQKKFFQRWMEAGEW